MAVELGKVSGIVLGRHLEDAAELADVEPGVGLFLPAGVGVELVADGLGGGGADELGDADILEEPGAGIDRGALAGPAGGAEEDEEEVRVEFLVPGLDVDALASGAAENRVGHERVVVGRRVQGGRVAFVEVDPVLGRGHQSPRLVMATSFAKSAGLFSRSVGPTIRTTAAFAVLQS